MSRRQALALATILAFCAVIVFAAHAVWHRHQSAALARTPSYQHGAAMMDLVTKDLLVQVIDPRAACRNDLVSSPGTFAGYSASTAIKGCVGEWTHANR
ncbi:MAG TPA: hypothetical protein VK662_07250 [Acidothermaceae bacterium]|nr:hypothetical protein [Acidothermaceae bacterium]